MAWNLQADRPIYTQILEQIQIRIISGYYKAGEKLPSVRELAAEANVNPNTMQKAFAELERSGLISTQRTSGRTVTEDTSMIEQLKNQQAVTQVQSFIETMKQLGYSKEEIYNLVTSTLRGGNE